MQKPAYILDGFYPGGLKISANFDLYTAQEI